MIFIILATILCVTKAKNVGDMYDMKFDFTPKRSINHGTVHVRWEVEGVNVQNDLFELCQVTNCHNVAAHRASDVTIPLNVPNHIPHNTTVQLSTYITDHSGNRVYYHEDEPFRVFSDETIFTSFWDSLGEYWTREHGIPLMDVNIQTFNKNAEIVREHNARVGEKYSLGINQFAHLDAEAFKNTYFGLKLNERSSIELNTRRSLKTIPDSVDWVEKGAVTPVKNQGACGSCWAFSTTGALEGAYFLKTGKLVSFSEQELVDCDHVDQGCNGGLMDNADRFIHRNGGLCTEQDVPYNARRGSCTPCTVVSGSAPHQVIDVSHTDESLEEALVRQPVSVAIEADQMAFQFYKRGVLTGKCGKRLDHGVLAVGYGTSDDGTKYYKVKNSWGPSWGMDGYILIERDVDVNNGGGECGILLSASYPVL